MELLTVFATVISGVLVFFFSQLLIELVLKPIQRFKNIKANIAYCLTYYGNTYANPSSEKSPWHDEASHKLRNAAAEMRGYCAEISKFTMFVPSKIKLNKVAENLIGLSNHMYKRDLVGEPLLSAYKLEKEIMSILMLSK